MTMLGAGTATLWFVSGLIGGTAYLAGLRANVRAYLGGGPAGLAIGLHVLRLGLVAAILAAVAAAAGLSGLLWSLAGFLAARMALLRRLKEGP